MCEIICINGSFLPEQLEFYKLHKISVPKQDKLYNIRALINNSNGKKGILLEEIKNPTIPFKHHILGIIHNEPNWDINRFRNLDQSEITKEQLNKILCKTH